METSVYTNLQFPTPPDSRPYCFINMVTTIDGKILSGSRDDHVLDLGSQTDHLLMKRLEQAADAVIIGANTLRASPPEWNPAPRTRIVVSSSGDLPTSARYFDSDRSYVATTTSSAFPPPHGVRLLRAGEKRVDFVGLFSKLRQDCAIRLLVVMGGSELNAQLLAANLVDELFITIAPKVKMGRDVPTYADGDALSRDHLQRYRLLEYHAIGDEIFIRYRRDGIQSDAHHDSTPK